jgi:quercetin dioxygenase-like cupin family protein
MAKKEMEFFNTDMVQTTRCAGPVEGLNEKILSRDEETGAATRLLIFDPGTDTSSLGAQKHDFWEEVYILEGEFFDLTLKKRFTAGMYACRPPNMVHGPWKTENGCKTFEVRYFVKPR